MNLGQLERRVGRRRRTISNAPRSTPQRTLLNHRPPSSASSGSSTNSASGFSSSVSVNEDPLVLGCGVAVPVGDAAGAGALCVTAGVMFRNDLNPTYRAFVNMSLYIIGEEQEPGTRAERTRSSLDKTYLRDDLADLTEVRTAAHVTPREEVLDEARADIVAHLLELLVHLGIVLVVLDELYDERAVREREELSILSKHT